MIFGETSDGEDHRREEKGRWGGKDRVIIQSSCVRTHNSLHDSGTRQVRGLETTGTDTTGHDRRE